MMEAFQETSSKNRDSSTSTKAYWIQSESLRRAIALHQRKSGKFYDAIRENGGKQEQANFLNGTFHLAGSRSDLSRTK